MCVCHCADKCPGYLLPRAARTRERGHSLQVSLHLYIMTQASSDYLDLNWYIFFTRLVYVTKYHAALCSVVHVLFLLSCHQSLSIWWTSVGPVPVSAFIYLFCFEGCKHLWYWFGTGRYDNSCLNRSVVSHYRAIRRREEEPRPHWPDKWPTALLTLWQRWHLCSFLYLSLLHLYLPSSLLSIAIEQLYWEWTIDHCSG